MLYPITKKLGMDRLMLNLRSQRWLHKPVESPGESKNEDAEVPTKSKEDPLTVDKFCLSPLNNRISDIAYPSKNQDQVKLCATRKAVVASDVSCSCRRSSRNSHQLRTEEQQQVPVNKSRARKKEKNKGKGVVDHGNNSSSLVNSCLSSASADWPAGFHPKKLISNGDKSSSLAAGFEPGTCTARDNMKYNIDSVACSSGDNENDAVFYNLSARKRLNCEECASTDDVEGNLLILQGSFCSVHGKAGESFAVVKISEDPYSDFKCSMVHMILEKNIYQPTELRGLLECFLSLNSPENHGIIIEAFTEICLEISSLLSEGM